MRHSIETIERIKDLRRSGYSIPEISNECNIAKSTVFRYAANIKISTEYYKRWLERRNASKISSERNWENAHNKAEVLFQSVTQRELALTGAMLYWAEGAKRDFSFCNTDAEMIQTFIYILRNVFNIKNHDLKISLRIYEDLDKNACLQFWSDVTGIKLDNATSIDVLKGRKNGKLKYGMCRVRVKKGGLLLKNFTALIKRVVFLLQAPIVQGIEQGTPKP